MGLKITLKPEEKMIVGNAVISNAGSSDSYISIENNATILREKNILSEKEANTPCKQIYFIIQLMYIDQINLPLHQNNYWKIIKQVSQAAPSTIPLIDEMNQHILKDDFYQALKAGRKLIDYEAEILNTFITSTLRNPASRGAGLPSLSI
ncbi:MAG: flagellar biosynthesis repressor FlbT [Proteobacteria bacterium]|nr:flagellar biosynthesis repressor FlbT [Pseudomonadota bacterium]MBU4471483.1 flagellar biosynthesis repressor FlbT [Pseudomonadota bacterium]MCG2752489.1 flagellar biosynthesis repressor FlbT [Desulfobacteraceae bacterium]